jgi:RecA-family ATPase
MHWLTRDIPEPDFMLGEMLSTTTRSELIGPTGIGKTNVLVAMALAVADGHDFLHWRGCGKPRRVLYIDGEMSRRLTKKRLADAAGRHGSMPTTFHCLNREDFPDLPPLNTENGQKFIDAVIKAISGADCVIFDNVQALLSGDMKDEEPWQQTLPWIRDLTRRGIGQIWRTTPGMTKRTGMAARPANGSSTPSRCSNASSALKPTSPSR